MGEVTPPGLRGEGDNRIRGNNQKVVLVVIMRIVVAVIMMALVTSKTM